MDNEQLFKAQTAFEEGHYDVAIKLLVKLAEKTNSSRVNHLLVRSLHINHQNQLAKKYLLRDLNSYTNNVDDFKLMIRVLLKNNDFIQARKIVMTVNDEAFKRLLLNLIIDKEKWVQQNVAVDTTEIKKQVYHLTAQPFYSQKAILVAANQLPLNDFLDSIRFVLKDPFINPLIRSELLQTLLDLGITENIDVWCIDDQIHQIDLKQLLPIEQTSSYKSIMFQIDNDITSDDHITIRFLKSTLRLDLIYLYPLNDLIIKNSLTWVKIAHAILLHQPLPLNQASAEIINWQKRLTSITESLSLK